MRRKALWLAVFVTVSCLSGCANIREIAERYEAPTEAIRVTNENEYAEVTSEEEIYDRLLATMNQNKKACYFNVTDESMIAPEKWKDTFDGIYSIDVEYTIAASGYNVGVTLNYWDNYPIVGAFKKNDTTLLNAKQLELFDRYCEILGNCTSSAYTQLENELAIHDYLVSNIEYDVEASNNIPQNLSGTNEKADKPEKIELLELGEKTTQESDADYTETESVVVASGSAYEGLVLGKTTCGGYAESFKTLLDLLGIENRLITGIANGQAHGWNLVCLDNEWYHVDVTWDDPINNDGTILHKYFNLTEEEQAKDHSWNLEKYPKATGTQYNYYALKNLKQIQGQKELEDYVSEQVKSGAEKIEFALYGEGDLATAFSLTGRSLNLSINSTNKPDFIIYEIGITYKE